MAKDESESQTGLVPYKGSGSFALATQDEAIELVKGAFAMGVRQFDLQRIKVPGSGGTVWSVPTMEGDEPAKALDVVIAHVQGRQRSWWAGPPGVLQNSPPNCSSTDGINGRGNNMLDQNPDAMGVHKCETCPWSAMGSKRTDKGPAGKGSDCKSFARLFFFKSDSAMPMVLSVPPGSLGNMSNYNVRLMGFMRPLHAVVTRLSLEATKNDSGQPYSKVKFDFVGDLERDSAVKFKQMATVLKENVSNITIDVTAQDLNG